MNKAIEIRENPGLCYQCSKCSSGCPVAENMELLPHQVMHYIALGMEDRVLRANTIWLCAGCFACAVRCPNDIDITSVMDDLRSRAFEQKITCPRQGVRTFHRTFLGDIARRGRLHELRMMGEYNLRTMNPFHNITIAPKMLLSGRLHLLPPKRLKGFKRWFRKLWKP